MHLYSINFVCLPKNTKLYYNPVDFALLLRMVTIIAIVAINVVVLVNLVLVLEGTDAAAAAVLIVSL